MMPASNPTQSPRASSPRPGRESPRAASPIRGAGANTRTANRPPLPSSGLKPTAAPIKAQALASSTAAPECGGYSGYSQNAAAASMPTATAIEALPSSGPPSPQPRPTSPQTRAVTTGGGGGGGGTSATFDRGRGSSPSAALRSAAAGVSNPTGLPNGAAEPETLKQALAMLRLLTSQLHEARGDKSAIWEQTRADARAMAQVAKNIEGNQGVVSGVISTLETQLEAARQEKERTLEGARADKKLFERLQREQERQLREVEKQRDKAQAAATEANAARQKAQDQLESARRTESDALRAAHAERAALTRELKALQEQGGASLGGGGFGGGGGGGGGAGGSGAAGVGTSEQLSQLTTSVGTLRAMLGGGSDGPQEKLVAAARAQRDEAEERLESLRSAMQAQLLSITRELEQSNSLLESERANRAPEMRVLSNERDAARREAAELRESLASCRAELGDARAQNEKLLVAAQLEQGKADSRAREHAQTLAAKDAHAAALERELASAAGQLVAVQAELRQMSAAAQAKDSAAQRERASLHVVQAQLEGDKAELQQQLRAATAQRAELVEQLAQCAGDREFCFDVIRELKTQLAVATSARGGGGGGDGGGGQAGAEPASPISRGGAVQEVRL